MSSDTSKRYTAEFKDSAVQKAKEIGVYKASQALGISSSSLYKWVSQAGNIASRTSQASGKPNNNGTEIENAFKILEENQQLKKENIRLKEIVALTV